LTELCKNKVLKWSRYGIICLNILSISSYIVIVIIDYQPFEFETFGLARPTDSFKLRVYEMVFILVLYVILVIVGCILMRQVIKYFAERPYGLIMSVVISLVDITAGLAIVAIMMNTYYISNTIIL
jgi:hypothetical protein